MRLLTLTLIIKMYKYKTIDIKIFLNSSLERFLI
jgi:hypothetical protein